MIRKHNSLHLFAEQELRDYFDNIKITLIHSIESENESYILNVNESDYIEHKYSQFLIDLVDIHISDIYASSSEQLIPAEQFPRGFNVYPGKSYKKTVIRFHIPFSGNPELLKYTPSKRFQRSIDVQIIGNDICFEMINFYDDVELIKREKDSAIDLITKFYEFYKEDIIAFNANLKNIITQQLQKRKQQIIKNNTFIASLGVPIKKSNSVPSTFSVPAPESRKKVIVQRPEVHESGYTPEPALDDNTYNQILKLIHDVGKEFERLPILYSGKHEEHLRDHFLMMLEPNFEGSATGETFNKTGKTDILLRFNGSNVFIAECKFWKGEKSLIDTITQLLGYLTWRDSKAAVIIFVSNKEFTSVIESMKSIIVTHPNFLLYKGCIDESWFNYTFHLPDDRNRTVKIAVMLYHLPK